jgi:hypothetical protein
LFWCRVPCFQESKTVISLSAINKRLSMWIKKRNPIFVRYK